MVSTSMTVIMNATLNPCNCNNNQSMNYFNNLTTDFEVVETKLHLPLRLQYNALFIPIVPLYTIIFSLLSSPVMLKIMPP